MNQLTADPVGDRQGHDRQGNLPQHLLASTGCHLGPIQLTSPLQQSQ
jgi:hypothetical protein